MSTNDSATGYGTNTGEEQAMIDALMYGSPDEQSLLKFAHTLTLRTFATRTAFAAALSDYFRHADDVTSPTAESDLILGSRVRIQGLVDRKDLNGKHGYVYGLDDPIRITTVFLEEISPGENTDFSGLVMFLKPTNLIVDNPKTLVEATALMRAAKCAPAGIAGLEKAWR